MGYKVATPRPQMMTCPSCAKSISVLATACPGCGHRFPRDVKTMSPIVVAGAIALTLFLLFFLRIF